LEFSAKLTNSVANFAENYFEKFDVMACEDDHNM